MAADLTEMNGLDGGSFICNTRFGGMHSLEFRAFTLH